MFSALVVAAFALALSCLPVFAIKFSLSDVRQCQSVNVSFSLKDAGPSKPSWLVFVPIDGVPTAVSIPTDATAGLAITALPFPAATSFYVILQDTFGRPVGNASDIITVLAPVDRSPASLACLPANVRSPPQYLLQDSLQQCGNFTIQYNTTLLPTAPSITLITAKDPGIPLNLTAENRTAGTATYLLAFGRTRHVILLFGAGTPNARTTSLITVGGPSNSSRACLSRVASTTSDNNSTKSNLPTASNAPSGSSSNSNSRSVLIASVVAAIVIVITAAAMIFFVVRYVRRRVPRNANFEPVFFEKGKEPLPVAPASACSPSLSSASMPASPPVRRGSTPSSGESFPAGSEKMVENPAYTSSHRVSYSSSSSFAAASVFANRIAQNHRAVASLSSRHTNFLDGHRSSASVASSRPLSVNTLDIEGMLNMASLKSNDASQVPAPLQPVPSSPFAPIPRAFSPPPATPPRKRNSGRSPALRRYPSRGHLRPPSDIPRGPASIISSSSTDPFSEAGSPVLPVFDLPRSSRQLSRSVSMDSRLSAPQALSRWPKAEDPPLPETLGSP